MIAYAIEIVIMIGRISAWAVTVLMRMSIVVIVLIRMAIVHMTMNVTNLADPTVTVGDVVGMVAIHQPLTVVHVRMLAHVSENNVVVQVDIAHVSTITCRLFVASNENGSSRLRVWQVVIRVTDEIQVSLHVGIGSGQSASRDRIRLGPLHALHFILINIRNEANT